MDATCTSGPVVRATAISAAAGALGLVLAADSFDPAQCLAVRLACEGFAMNIGSPYLTEEERALAHARLLELAEPH